jgi:phospholipid-translocating ATPase
MLLMCIWVVAYSFFDSIAFNREAVVLFSTVGFWTTVIYAIILALGPHFITKFVHEAYFPADRDIIREAWVVGDLKDRLGIKHRKSSKGSTTSQMEGASLFRPHMRGVSDHSSDQETGGYEPVVSQHMAALTPAAKSSDNLESALRRQPTAMSYYSASDIPISETPVAPERRPNLTLHPSSAYRSPERSGTSPTSPLRSSPTSPPSPGRQQSPIRPAASPTRLSPTPVHNAGEFEMSLRTIHSQHPSNHSQASAASFHTASDGGWESENDDNATIRDHATREPYHPQEPHAS